MLAVLLFTLYTTLLSYFLFPKIGLAIKSSYLKLSLAWFLGIFNSTLVIFLFALIYSLFGSQVLIKASFTFLLLLILCGTIPVLQVLKGFHLSLKNILLSRKQFTAFNVLVVGACLLFSFLFFSPQLAMKDTTIFTSPIYWDFHWHAAVIQNFVYGDNFPPQNESFSGAPMTYHFFGDLVFGIYESLGLSLVAAINYGSILAFFFSLLAVIGTGEELFSSKAAGVIAAILLILSGSGHFFYYLATLPNQSIFQITGTILSNSEHPWYISYIPGNPYDYTGVFFNLFYYLEERHLIFGIPYLLFCLFVIYKRHSLSGKKLLLLGIFLGLFFYWEVYIAIMVLGALIFVLIFDKKRKETLYLFVGFLATFMGCYILLKYVVSNPMWFIPAKVSYPQFDFNFVTNMGPHAFSLTEYFSNLFRNYAFAYGLRGIFFFISISLLWKKNKQLAKVLLAIVIPTFILMNTTKLSPGVSENHKWLVPMNTFVDIIAAYAVSLWFFEKRKFLVLSLGFICLFFLTFSGIIELMPFLNSQPDIFYNQYHSPVIAAIQKYSSPHDNFLSITNEKAIHLAGRKLYIGPSAGPDYAMNKIPRIIIASDIYKSSNIQNFCKLTQAHTIDFVDIDTRYQNKLFHTLQSLPYFTTSDATNIFFDAKDGCR